MYVYFVNGIICITRRTGKYRNYFHSTRFCRSIGDKDVRFVSPPYKPFAPSDDGDVWLSSGTHSVVIRVRQYASA